MCRELFHYFRRQVLLEIPLDVECFPPAIDYLPARVPLRFTGFTVEKIDRAPEPGAPSHELCGCVSLHWSGSVLKSAVFDMLRFRIIGQNAGILVLLFLTECIILKVTGKVFVVRTQVDKPVTAPVK